VLLSDSGRLWPYPQTRLIRLGWRSLPGRNTLAYYKVSYMRNMFMILKPGVIFGCAGRPGTLQEGPNGAEVPLVAEESGLERKNMIF
jgi:hypothetical protein